MDFPLITKFSGLFALILIAFQGSSTESNPEGSAWNPIITKERIESVRRSSNDREGHGQWTPGSMLEGHSELPMSPKESKPRQRREVKNLNIRLLLVIDTATYQIWLQRLDERGNMGERIPSLMRKFYRTMQILINDQLRSLNVVNTRLRVSITDVYINYEVDAQIHQGHTKKEQILIDFQEWLGDHKFEAYDHALLLTYKELIENDYKKYRDDAWLGTICTNQSVSVIPENFIATSVAITRELAHSLGIRRDGDGNDCVSNKYIMANDWMSLTSEWQKRIFSECSSNYAAERILNGKTLDCLANSHVPSEPSLLPGQILKTDSQCRIAIGRNSYVCREYVSSVCSELWCYNGTNGCVRIQPYDGTKCGEKKRCLNGVCTEDKNAPSVSDYYPFLDRKSAIPGINITCQDISQNRQWECFREDIALACSKICPTEKCGDKMCCKYKEEPDQCAGIKEYACYSRGMARTCCITCKKHCIKKIANCSCGDKKHYCSEIKAIDCYKRSEECCESCFRYKRPEKKNCEYGDRTTECRVENCIGSNSTYKTKCCETCFEVTNSSNNRITVIGGWIWILWIKIYLFVF